MIFRITQFSIIVLLVSIIGCTSTKTSQHNNRLVIQGKIVDYVGSDGEITFMFSNAVDASRIFEQVKYKIDSNGFFKIDTIFGFSQEVLSPYGFLYCSPGDSLYLEIENSQIKSISGIGATLNRELLAFRQFFSENYPDSTKHLTYDQFVDYIDRREQIYLESLDEFLEANNPCPTFLDWVEDIITYDSWNDLLRYPWLHARYNKIPADSLSVPESYYSFLENYDMNDFDILSRNHILFLHEYFRYCMTNPSDSLKLANDLGMKGDTTAAVKMRLRMITSKTSGLTEQLFLTKFHHVSLKGRDTIFFKKYFDSSQITLDYFLWELQREEDIARSFLSNQNTQLANTKDFSDVKVSEILQSIISQYVGNVIYIDFWAPWCAPCLREMPHSKKLQEQFESKDVTFLYLGNQCREDAWKASIANNQLSGEHILLSGSQYEHLSKKYGISGIPHYMLVDRRGQLVSPDAIRPSRHKEISDIINQYLLKGKP